MLFLIVCKHRLNKKKGKQIHEFKKTKKNLKKHKVYLI